jgi:Zn-dependent peptidase ImmA (M78 family)
VIEDNFQIRNWNIKILYDCTCDDIDTILETLKDIKCPSKYIKEAIDNLESCALNIGLTYSNINLKSSVIVVNKTSSIFQLINTISHEYYHLICHLEKGLNITNEEELARLNGDLNMRSYKIVK